MKGKYGDDLFVLTSHDRLNPRAPSLRIPWSVPLCPATSASETYRDAVIQWNESFWIRICKIEYHLSWSVLRLRRESHRTKRQSQIIASFHNLR